MDYAKDETLAKVFRQKGKGTNSHESKEFGV